MRTGEMLQPIHGASLSVWRGAQCVPFQFDFRHQNAALGSKGSGECGVIRKMCFCRGGSVKQTASSDGFLERGKLLW